MIGPTGFARVAVATRAVTAVALMAVAALALGACSEEREPQTVEVVVPAGTQQRIFSGETVEVMPAHLEFRVGDTLVIRNEDSVAQSVGPYFVAAGEEMRLTYGAPGVYEGYCPLSEGERYEIVVEE